jgi:hypothetical protein
MGFVQIALLSCIKKQNLSYFFEKAVQLFKSVFGINSLAVFCRLTFVFHILLNT